MRRDKTIILKLRDMAIEHKKLSELYSKVADDLENKKTVLTETRKDLSSNSIDVWKMNQIKRFKLTTKYFILKIFEDGVPRTARQLLTEFNKVSGRQLNYHGFVTQLSTLKKNDVISTQEFTMYRTNARFIYGLPNWFDNGKLKKEFLDKFVINEKAEMLILA
jgi:hypothetical protein